MVEEGGSVAEVDLEEEEDQGVDLFQDVNKMKLIMQIIYYFVVVSLLF